MGLGLRRVGRMAGLLILMVESWARLICRGVRDGPARQLSSRAEPATSYPYATPMSTGAAMTSTVSPTALVLLESQRGMRSLTAGLFQCPRPPPAVFVLGTVIRYLERIYANILLRQLDVALHPPSRQYY
ncbi:hypothetical protein BJX70DRAFT_28489 [Aspergillus crustosus]